MSLLALALVLIAACLHATWNLAAKRVGSGLPFVFAVGVVMSAIYLPIVIGFAAAGRLSLSPSAAWVIAVSTVLKTGYALYLQRAYRAGDFSLVYPVVRGIAPVLATAGAVLFLGERPTALGIAGAAVIVVSIFFLNHGERLWQTSDRRGTPIRHSLGNAIIAGSCIASYTVWDRHAMSGYHLNPVVYDGLTNIGLTVLLLPFALPRFDAVKQIWRAHRREVLIMAILSPTAYVLVLTAMTFTPVSYIAPAREFSILIGAFLGAHVLKEPHSPRRLRCAVAMVLGLTALALA